MNSTVPHHLHESSSALEVRLAARSGQLTGHTSGLARQHVQANLAILPKALADDFLRYCQRNPKPCPLLAVGEPGQYRLTELGHDLDIRTDLPRYRVWQAGELVDEPTDLAAVWRDDMVVFALGCSFSFEHGLLAAGIRLRHVEQGRNVAMFRTNIPTRRAGPFQGPMVVTMRPLKAADAIKAVQITSRVPEVHGAPVHIGDPSQIGISDLSRPDYGDAVEVMPDELPVFWACGVTPQAAIAASKPAFCITHAPGCMLVTDRLNDQLGLG
ncbi:putative hydro-lyase [Hydrogenophaga luteola]|uniref:Putative hydro-lyase ACFOPI_22935 n=1 Tax=Hydrogenophaga luteola TaxID=1591122 RepID=A0ABV7WBM5_9BURK